VSLIPRAERKSAAEQRARRKGKVIGLFAIKVNVSLFRKVYFVTGDIPRGTRIVRTKDRIERKTAATVYLLRIDC